MEVDRAPYKTTILHTGPSMNFHVNLGEGTYLSLFTYSFTYFEVYSLNSRLELTPDENLMPSDMRPSLTSEVPQNTTFMTTIRVYGPSFRVLWSTASTHPPFRLQWRQLPRDAECQDETVNREASQNISAFS